MSWGRIRYRFEFSNLLPQAIEEYLDDNLLPDLRGQREKILEQVDLLEISTIDILKALVDEVNIHGALPENASPTQLLTHLSLMDEKGRLSNSAVLLFGKRPQEASAGGGKHVC